MEKKNIVILGGGFGGISVLRVLSRYTEIKEEYKIIVIDRKGSYEFLPMIADILAGWLLPQRISVNLESAVLKEKARFIQKEVQEINLKDKYVYVGGERINYEYAVVATGGVPVFFGNKSAETNCYRFNSIKDVLSLREELKERAKNKELKNLVVVGGGYTGIEVATNAKFFLEVKNKYRDFDITIVEKAPDIMMMVPEFLRNSVKKELKKLQISIQANDTLDKYENNKVYLQSGKIIDDAVCVWVSGVKTAPFLDKVDAEKLKTRIKVDEYLNISGSEHKDAFIIGDSAAFINKKTGAPLRQAIMFSISQGRVTAENIVHKIKGEPLKSYKPKDLGFLLPLTYLKAPGIVMGIPVISRLGYFLHYYMCIYRSDLKSKSGILKDLVLRRFFGK